MIKWFVYKDNEVKGPYETQEVKSQHRSGKIQDQTLVWGRLQEEWIFASEWLQQVDDLIAKMGIYSHSSRMWHFSYEKKTYGPFSRDDLLGKLKRVPNPNLVFLWTTGMDKWDPIFEFHDVLDDLGLNQRSHARAAIEGTVLITKKTGDVLAGELSTISIGGLGFFGASNLFPGEDVTLEIISENFRSHLRVNAEIRYVSEKNFIGVRYGNMHSEVQSQIIEYVKKSAITSKIFKSNKETQKAA